MRLDSLWLQDLIVSQDLQVPWVVLEMVLCREERGRKREREWGREREREKYIIQN